MEACPACTASMRDGLLHCDNPACDWWKCGKCRATINDDGTYWTANVWGNENGYIKAEDAKS